MGKGQNAGPCMTNGAGAYININSGTPVDISGKITEINRNSLGFKVDNGSEIISVYGLAPVWYWNKQRVKFPSVSDNITVHASKVTSADGSERIIARTIKVDGHEIVLRDSDSGMPLWKSN